VRPKQYKKNWTVDPAHRRSMSVLLSVGIQVSGKAADGKDFNEETRTLVVYAHGALISLTAHVAAGETITIANKATRQSIECRVVYLGNPQAGKMEPSVEFVKPLPSFCQIDFPPDNWVVPPN
jgi:hypothetical protein